MNKEKLIRKIEENFEDIKNALVVNDAFDVIVLFRDYTDEVIRIIEEEME